MEEPTIEVLIDLYLSGAISPGDKARLEQAMATDPAVAEMVHDSQRAYKALLLERKRLLKEKLKKLDREDVPQQRNTPRKWKIISYSTAVVLLIFMMLHVYMSPQCIARRQLIAHPISHVDATPASTEMKRWEEARKSFLNKDFEMAIQQYLVLAGEETTPVHFKARWNILMAQLAVDGPTSSWHLAMDAFIQEAPVPFSTQAKSLSAKFSSPYYRFFFGPWKDKLSSLKPRLI
jgi:hypothetical protein